MNNKKKHENFKSNHHERRTYDAKAHRYRNDGRFCVYTAVTELCECCNRNELYIASFRIGLRKNYDKNTLWAIYHNSLNVREYAMDLLSDIATHLAECDPMEPEVKWFLNNHELIVEFLDGFEKYVRNTSINIPRFTLPR